VVPESIICGKDMKVIKEKMEIKKNKIKNIGKT